MSGRLYMRGISLFAFVLALTSCVFHPAEKGDNKIQFDSIEVDKIYHLLGNNENPNCNLQIKFIYPVGCSDPNALEKMQAEFVRGYFGDAYDKKSPKEAVSSYANDYIDAYKDLESVYKEDLGKSKKEDLPVGSWYSYYEISSNEIKYNKNGLLAFTVCFENYTGGAHGAHSFMHRVIDVKKGTPVEEADLFVDNYQDQMAQVILDQIAKQNNVSNPKKLEELGFFSIDEIYPNNNFYLDDEAITYTYNEYEIAAYVVGRTDVRIPYSEIKHLLRQDGTLSTLLKNLK